MKPLTLVERLPRAGDVSPMVSPQAGWGRGHSPVRREGRTWTGEITGRERPACQGTSTSGSQKMENPTGRPSFLEAGGRGCPLVAEVRASRGLNTTFPPWDLRAPQAAGPQCEAGGWGPKSNRHSEKTEG